MKKGLENTSHYHSLSIKETLKRMSTTSNGLREEEAKLRLEKYGLNELKEKKPISPLIIFLKQFNSFFVYILIIAAIISFIVKNLIDMYVIIAVIIINSSIGFFQEYRAEKSISALKQMIVQYARVYRNIELIKIPTKNLVPGDIILLEEGDRIPADARLLEIKNLTTVEASLTGESIPVIKKLSNLKQDTALADRSNMLWMGTFIATGTAKAVVIATNDETVLGSIVKDIETIKSPKSHFQQKTNTLAIQMSIIAIIGAMLTFIIGYFIRGFDFLEILIFTIASLVGGIPEGLPAVLAIVLGIGAFKMARRNAIIRRLPATETLGVVNIIITDKTGTLTLNTLTVEKILLPNEEEISVSGDGWNHIGEFIQKKTPISPLENPQLSKLLHISAICNNSKVIKEENQEKYSIIGDPTEAALLVLAEKAGLKKEVIEAKEERIEDLPFNQILKCRASLSSLTKEKKKQVYVIGAPEIILKESTYILKLNTEKKLTHQEKNLISKQITYLTSKAMRVLAIAYKNVHPTKNNLSDNDINNLTYVGLVGMIDPPRPEVEEAIEKAHKAGIRVIMVTGDHKNTARAIAKEIRLIKTDSEKVLTEEELSALSPQEFEETLKTVNVFTRLSPHMKFKIASTLQKHGNIIAMTGDGVNDAPALKKSDIGIAMGIMGTDVARESAEIVLTDDNFASIINAVEEGRMVFTNTKQTSFFLITTNFATDLTIISTLLMGFPIPLLPTQILWLNLVTDTCPAIGLAAEPTQNSIHEEKPKNPKENILTKEIIPFLFLMTLIMSVLTALIFFYFIEELTKARTAAFVVITLTQLFNSFNMRSLNKSLFKVGIFTNKYLITLLIISFLLLLLVVYIPLLQNLFEFTTLTILEFIILLALSSLVLWTGEAYKLLRKK